MQTGSEFEKSIAFQIYFPENSDFFLYSFLKFLTILKMQFKNSLKLKKNQNFLETLFLSNAKLDSISPSATEPIKNKFTSIK